MRGVRVGLAAVSAAIVTMTLTSGASPAAGPCRPGPAASCAGATLDGAKLQRRNLTGATLTRARLVGARLQSAKLVRANLTAANLTRANLTGADLRGATLTRARLRNAILRRARLGRHTTASGRPAAVSAGSCRMICSGGMRGADFRGADMEGVVLLFADLRGADLRSARLVRTHIAGTKLNDARLDGANLSLTTFEDVDLRGASLRGADLTGARFLRTVDLRGADLAGADLRGVDLSGVQVRPEDLAGARLAGAILPERLVVRTEITSGRPFSATLSTGPITATCTDAISCEGVGAPDTAATVSVTTSWAGFAFCPDGPVRLTSADGGATYTGTCTFSAVQSLTIRLREARGITVRVRDLGGLPATIDRVAFEWREAPGYGLVEPAHACTGVGACIGEYAEGSAVRVLITGSGPYLLPDSASCTGGTPVGGSTMVSAPPWELTCLVDGDGHPLRLDADRELAVTLS